LYDGPPPVEPVGVKMITFTSPNFVWLDSMKKHASHKKLFMPVWDIDELRDAVEMLGLNIDDAELEKRFTFFGGSARYCLSKDEEFVNEAYTDVNIALSKISGFQMVEDCLNGNLDNDKIVHRLMHYMPNPNKRSAYLVPASLQISLMLKDRIGKKEN
jgi:hypothetical protein